MGIGMVVNLSTRPDRSGNPAGKGSSACEKAGGRAVRRRDIYVIVVLMAACLAAGGYLSIHYQPQGSGSQEQAATATWLGNYSYRVQISIQNLDTGQELPTGYPVAVTLTYPDLVSSGKMKADLSDLRIAHQSPGQATELPRHSVATKITSTQATLYFQLVQPVPAGAADQSYYIYYGNQNAGSPPVSYFDTSGGTVVSPKVVTVQEEKIPEAAIAPAMAAAAAALALAFIVVTRQRA